MAESMMKLGLFLEGTGHHTAAWRDPDVDPMARQSLPHFIDIARLAERGKFDMLFLADTNATFGADDVESWTRTTLASRLEPITLLSAWRVTGTTSSSPPRPRPTSSRFRWRGSSPSLDKIGGGRAAGSGDLCSPSPRPTTSAERRTRITPTAMCERASSPRSCSDYGKSFGKTTPSSPTRNAASTSTATSFIPQPQGQAALLGGGPHGAPLAARSPGDPCRPGNPTTTATLRPPKPRKSLHRAAGSRRGPRRAGGYHRYGARWCGSGSAKFPVTSHIQELAGPGRNCITCWRTYGKEQGSNVRQRNADGHFMEEKPVNTIWKN